MYIQLGQGSAFDSMKFIWIAGNFEWIEKKFSLRSFFKFNDIYLIQSQTLLNAKNISWTDAQLYRIIQKKLGHFGQFFTDNMEHENNAKFRILWYKYSLSNSEK